MSGHQISWGDDFNEWPDKRKIDYLKKLASSMNHATDLMQQERDALTVKVTELEAMLVNAQQAHDTQKAIIANAILESNERRQSDAETIRVLKSEAAASGD